VLACEIAAALPQSPRHLGTDGGRDDRIYRDLVFASVLVALSGHAEGRDALVLATQLAGADGTIVVTHVMATSAAPLTGGSEAAARRRAHLRDAGEEVYATLGPDPRVRYVPLSGLPFAEAVGALARREQPDAIVVGQNLISHEPGVRRLLADAPCAVAVAPYGHRFVRSFAPARVTVACGPPGATDDAVAIAAALAARIGADVRLVATGEEAAEDWLAHAQGLAPAAAATRVAGRGPRALVAQTRGDVDVLVTAGADDELLRQAACPVLVVTAAAPAAGRLAAETRR
jgi:NAD(P)H-hydrate repair Nnr-like enzyme with NAD(P)H-hydrate epimerase domain